MRPVKYSLTKQKFMKNIKYLSEENIFIYIVLLSFGICLVMPQVTIFTQDDKTLRMNPHDVVSKSAYIFLLYPRLCCSSINQRLSRHLNQFILVIYKLAAVFILFCVINPVKQCYSFAKWPVTQFKLSQCRYKPVFRRRYCLAKI